MKNVLRTLIFTAIVATLALPAFAQATTASQTGGTTTAAASPQDEQAKADLYAKFYANVSKTDAAAQKTAYEAGKEYLSKYSGDKSEENVAIVKYIQDWVTKYETVVRDFEQNRNLEQAFETKNYSRAYELSRQRLSAQPDDVALLIRLAQAGYLNARGGNKSLNTDATNYTRTAIRLIEQGKAPDKWTPFANQADTLGWLNYTLGFLTLETAPEQAPTYFIKAAQSNSTVKNDPTLFFYLGNSYFEGEYKKLAAEYKANFEGKEETDSSRALLARLDQVADRIIDAWARTVSLSNGTKPEEQRFKESLMAQLTAIYKNRHDNSDAGLKELIAGVQSKPLPLPGAPVTAPATTAPTGTTTPATSGGTTAAPASTNVSNTMTPPASNGNARPAATTTATPAAKPASTTAPAGTPKPISKTTAPAAKTKSGKVATTARP